MKEVPISYHEFRVYADGELCAANNVPPGHVLPLYQAAKTQYDIYVEKYKGYIRKLR